MAFHHPAVLLTTFDLSSQVFTLLACTRRVASKCVQQLSRCTGNSNWNHFSARLIVPPKHHRHVWHLLIACHLTSLLLHFCWNGYMSLWISLGWCIQLDSVYLTFGPQPMKTGYDIDKTQRSTQAVPFSGVDLRSSPGIMDPLEIILSHTPLFKNRTPFIEKKSEKWRPSVQLQALLWILSAPGAFPNRQFFRRDEKKGRDDTCPLSTLPWPDMRCTKASLYILSYKIDYTINRFMYTCIHIIVYIIYYNDMYAICI